LKTRKTKRCEKSRSITDNNKVFELAIDTSRSEISEKTVDEDDADKEGRD
jgi:hypothetical protein